MTRPGIRFILTLTLTAVAGYSQAPESYLEIRLSSAVKSESLFVRYAVAGDDLGGWVQPRAGVSAYRISAIRNGAVASGIRAIVYAAGCGIETVDVPFHAAENHEYLFLCRPVGSVPVNGLLQHREILKDHGAVLQAKYIARWAPAFLGIDGNVPLTIPVGAAALTPDGRFQLSIPDFPGDRASELQLWAIDRNSGVNIAQLIPAGSANTGTKTNGLRLPDDHTKEIVFSLCMIDHPPLQLRTREGFAIRPDPPDGCER